MNCHNCNSPQEREDMIGANIFLALTGSHIITRWFCEKCAYALGLLKQ